jgi:hypothetical protein
LVLGRVKTPTPAAPVETILEKLRVLRIDDSSDTRMDAVLENCIFYSFPMYEFSHRQTLSSSSVENLPLIKDQRVTTDAVNAVNFLDARWFRAGQADFLGYAAVLEHDQFSAGRTVENLDEVFWVSAFEITSPVICRFPLVPESPDHAIDYDVEAFVLEH